MTTPKVWKIKSPIPGQESLEIPIQAGPSTPVQVISTSDQLMRHPMVTPVKPGIFIPSEYQQEIFNWVRTGSGNAIVDAKAGSGKTTTIVEALKLLPPGASVIFLAFNKSVQLALQSKITPTHPQLASSIRTLNSLGHQTWGRHVGARLNVDADKMRSIVDTINKRGTKYGKPAVALSRMAKAYGIVPFEAGSQYQRLMPDNLDSWYTLLNLVDSDEECEDELIIETAREALTISIGHPTWIDFDDQFYMPIIHGSRFQPYNWIFVDEAQDVSYIQQEVIARTFGPASRFVGVGDPRQALYGFRGASPKSLYELRVRFNCVTFDLPVSYRCPLSVIREAQKIEPGILPKPDAKEGSVKFLGTKFLPTDFRKDDMVVCRVNSPLVELAYSLWSAKIPCRIVGKELGTGIIKLIKSLRAHSLVDLGNKMVIWRDKETRRALKRDPHADTSFIEERFNVIDVFLTIYDLGSIDELLWEIENLFGDSDDGRLRLSSVHRAKGLEAPRVFIYNKYMMPSKRAKLDWQIEQEMNILYVAITRSMDELIYIDDGKENSRG